MTAGQYSPIVFLETEHFQYPEIEEIYKSLYNIPIDKKNNLVGDRSHVT